jgi:uncharacterized membrane protein
MMERIRSFAKTSFLGGVAVILPVVIFLLAFAWLWRSVTRLMKPVTRLVMRASNAQETAAAVFAFLLVLALCFVVGAVVKTRVGRFFYRQLEERIRRVAPGYSLIKDIVEHVVGRQRSPLSAVALVRLFDSEALATAFVTERHANGWVTVFVPCGLNPTTGNIYHLPAARVHPVEAGAEEAMRSIISCGIGSGGLLESCRELPPGS